MHGTLMLTYQQSLEHIARIQSALGGKDYSTAHELVCIVEQDMPSIQQVMKYTEAECKEWNQERWFSVKANLHRMRGFLRIGASEYEAAHKEFTTALSFATARNLGYIIAKTYENLAALCNMRSQYKESLDYLELSRDTNAYLQYPSDMERLHGNIGIAHTHLGHFKQALHDYTFALQWAEQNNHIHGKAVWLGCIGILSMNLADYPRALQDLSTALDYAAIAQDTALQANYLIDLSRICVYTQQFDKAGFYLDKAAETGTLTVDRTLHLRIMGAQAIYHLEIGHYEQGLELCEKALDLSRELDLKVHEASVLTTMAQIYSRLHQADKSLFLIHQACEIYKVHGTSSNYGRVLGNMGVYYSAHELEKRNPLLAINLLDQAISILHQAGDKKGEYHAHHDLAALYAEEKQWSKAYKHMRTCSNLHNQIHDNHLNLSLARHQIDLMQKENALLMEKNAQLAKMNQEKNEFLGIASHDLKNPLNAIMGTTLILRDMPVNSKQEFIQLINNIKMTGSRMLTIVKNILDSNKLEQESFKTNIQPVSVPQMIAELCQIWYQPAINKHIRIITDIPEYALALCDAQSLFQIMDNLVSNAVKFSYFHSTIHILCTVANDRVNITVQDHGPGFSDEDKKHLFKRFNRLSARPTGGESSTGLGLSIIKKLAELMNGSLSCHSIHGQGAAFTLCLPAASATVTQNFG
jgi:signal transduction histidine kinase